MENTNTTCPDTLMRHNAHEQSFVNEPSLSFSFFSPFHLLAFSIFGVNTLSSIPILTLFSFQSFLIYFGRNPSKLFSAFLSPFKIFLPAFFPSYFSTDLLLFLLSETSSRVYNNIKEGHIFAPPLPPS